VLDAVNALQRTAWAVNGRMLEVMRELAKGAGAGEVTTLQDIPKPTPPHWLSDDWTTTTPKDQWPEDKRAEFVSWKRRVSEWHTERKLRATKYSRFYTTTRMADMYLGYPALYFVYFADSRGRLYPMTTGINPQGSDMQKALLHFAKGLPLDTPEAVRWFHVQGANKWGFDKATLAERHQWVVDNQEKILAFAKEPLDNLGWRDAGDPFQFLAWCFEYAEWYYDNDGTFVSRIPVSMDGSCNGLQNLSAVLRDEVGGKATNLVPNATMEDIYRRVGEAATIRLQDMRYEEPEKERIRLMWLEHGISRSYVKRSVMTTPYGVTKRSAIDYVIEDTLRRGEGPRFDPKDHFTAATVLMDAAWPAIGDIVVKGVECMAWLKRCSGIILRTLPKEAEPIIQWMSPSGFPAAQSYFEETAHRIHTHIAGGMKIRINAETDVPSKSRHANGMAPNFVHSLDAAHLHLTASAARSAGIDDLAMIHDDYGTHAANSQKLFEIIRQEFVSMYEGCDPLADLKARYPSIPEPPEPGSLEIREVLQSQFFFS
jgi:DNA-directed RNA polymerase